MHVTDIIAPAKKIIRERIIREFDREGAIYPRLSVLWWRGGDERIENVFKKHMDRIVFWGGGEALKNWEKDLGKSVTLVRHGPKTFEWTIIFEEKEKLKEFEPSPLNRTIIIKRYSSLGALADLFRGHSFYLQTAGYCLDKSQVREYAVELSSRGVTRLCPFGMMSIPSPGTPHDGGFALRELTRFTVVDS